MSTFPPDEPTRVVRQPAVPLDAAVPLQPAPAVAAPVGVDPRWAAAMDDRLRSLRTLTTLLGLLSLIALGVAVWALTHDDNSGRQGASRGRVAALDRRVDRLENRSTPADTGATTANVASAKDVAALQAQVDELKTQGQAGGQSDGASSADVTALATRVDRLAAQVAELRTQGGGDTGTTGP